MLDKRAEKVLRAVVEFHMERMEPVGAATLSKDSDFNLCPASIRSVMSDLEKQGFLSQPHTSAGRVPSDKGYSYYARNLASPVALPPGEMEDIRRAASGSGMGELANFMGTISRALSTLSMQAGLVGLGSWGSAPVSKTRFVNINGSSALAVVVFEGGGIKNLLITTPRPYGQDELDKISNYLTHRFAGLPLARIRQKLLDEMKEEKNAADNMVLRALFVAEAMENSAASPGSIHVEGAGNLIGQLGSGLDMARIKAIFKTFDEKSRLVSLLNELLKSEGVNLIIGAESDMEEMGDLSLVTHTFSGQQGAMGAVGIIGPKRMNYGRAMSLVTYAARQLTLKFAGRGGDGEDDF